MTDSAKRVWSVARKCVAMPLFLIGVVFEELAYAIGGDLDD